MPRIFSKILRHVIKGRGEVAGNSNEAPVASRTSPAKPSTALEEVPRQATPSTVAQPSDEQVIASGILALVSTSQPIADIRPPAGVVAPERHGDQDFDETQPMVPPTAGQPLFGSHSEQPSDCPANAHSPIQDAQQQPEAQPPTRPSLWHEAIEKLPDDYREWIEMVQAESSTPESNIVSDMICRTREKQQQCEERRWRTFRVRGVSIQEMASKTIVWLSKFKEIGDIVVQYDPVHAALPWAAARFILQAAVADREQMAASLAIVEKTARVVHRCQIFELLYSRDALPLAVVEGLESVLVELYALVLQGLVQTYRILSKHTAARALHALFDPTGASDLLSKIEDCEALVGREVQACEAQRSAKMDSNLQGLVQKLQCLLNLEKPLLRVDENVNSVLQRLDIQELIAVRQWISPIEYGRHHETVKSSRTKDTCDWLLKRVEFYEWQSATSTATLWLQGLPGSGKTYLTSRVIDQIREDLAAENSEGFAFFYCNRNEPQRRDALHVLRSYVRQLSAAPCAPDTIHPQLKQLYLGSRLRGSGWTLTLCREYLVKLLDFYPRTTLVLDALDECLPGEREILMDCFNSVAKVSSKPVKIFISSRPEGDIQLRFNHMPNIEVLATDNEADIAKFVTENIERNGRWSRTLNMNQALKNEIAETILDKSRGMFQWAKLQIEQLLNLRSELELRERLGKLPKDLKSAYDWCAHLLYIDSQHDPPVWRVSHLSVVEYLESHHCPLVRAHCFVATASLAMLLATHGDEHDRHDKPVDFFHLRRLLLRGNFDGRKKALDRHHPAHPLLIYVHHHWIRHVQTQEGQEADSKLASLLKAFLGSPQESSMQYIGWCHRNEARSDNLPLSSALWGVSSPDLSPKQSPIFAMCRFSFYTLLADWWDSAEIDIFRTNDRGDNLLLLAATGGCREICEALIRRGMVVGAKFRDKDGRGLVAAAAATGNLKLVEFFVEQGADVNIRGRHMGSALTAAATTGNLKLVEFLVEQELVLINGAGITTTPLQQQHY